MPTSVLAARLGYGILLAGGALAFLAAMVPHYHAGYRLDGGILLAGIVPYLLYLLPAVLWRTLPSVIAGLGVLAVHAVVVVRLRWLDGSATGDSLLYVVPLLLAAALVPIAAVALRQPWHG